MRNVVNKSSSEFDIEKQFLLLENVRLRKALRAIRKKTQKKQHIGEHQLLYKAPTTPKSQRFVPTLPPVREVPSPTEAPSSDSPFTPAASSFRTHCTAINSHNIFPSFVSSSWPLYDLSDPYSNHNKRIDYRQNSDDEDEDPSTTSSTPLRPLREQTMYKAGFINSEREASIYNEHKERNVNELYHSAFASPDIQSSSFNPAIPSTFGSRCKNVDVEVDAIDAIESNSPVTEREKNSDQETTKSIHVLCCAISQYEETAESIVPFCTTSVNQDADDAPEHVERDHAEDNREHVHNSPIEFPRADLKNHYLFPQETREVPNLRSSGRSVSMISPVSIRPGDDGSRNATTVTCCPNNELARATLNALSLISKCSGVVDMKKRLRPRQIKISYKEPSLRKKLRRDTKNKIYDPFLYCKAATLQRVNTLE